MNSFDKLKLRMASSGLNQKEEQIKDARRLIEIENINDVSFCDTLVYWNTTTKIHGRLLDRKYSSNYGKYLSFQSPLDEPIILGDLVTDTSTNINYLCVESYNDNVRCYGKLCETNYTVKFQISDATILSYPCIDSSNSSIGENENSIISIGNKQHTLKLPFDTYTAQLDVGKRLYIDKRKEKKNVYKITSVDSTTYNYGEKGLIEFYLIQDVEQNITPYPDKPDLGICNYFTNTSNPATNNGTKYSVITCSNKQNQITIGGIESTLSPKFFNDTNSINTDITAVWNYYYPSGYENQFIITPVVGSNNVKIKAKDNEDILGKTLTATVSDGNGNYVSNIKLDIVIS
jgi:hypothetical protein